MEETVLTLWKKMSIDEYADYEGSSGTRLVKVDGVWWRAVRPFFYRPLFPFQRLAPEKVKPPFMSRLFGYQYPVIEGRGPANSYLNIIVFDDIHDYSLDTLKKEKRYKIKKALKNLSVRRIDDYDEFIEGGYPVYQAFFHRTKYKWKNDRIYRQAYMNWAKNVFRFPQIVIHGAYLQGELSAITISYLVEDVIIDAVFFSTTEALKMGSSEASWHVIREYAAEMRDVRYIYEGPVLGQRGLDDSKIFRGCKICCQPAYFSINPLAQFILETTCKTAYAKLLGMDERQVEEKYYSGKQA
jgi:hypothetical protein